MSTRIRVTDDELVVVSISAHQAHPNPISPDYTQDPSCLRTLSRPLSLPTELLFKLFSHLLHRDPRAFTTTSIRRFETKLSIPRLLSRKRGRLPRTPSSARTCRTCRSPGARRPGFDLSTASSATLPSLDLLSASLQTTANELGERYEMRVLTDSERWLSRTRSGPLNPSLRYPGAETTAHASLSGASTYIMRDKAPGWSVGNIAGRSTRKGARRGRTRSGG